MCPTPVTATALAATTAAATLQAPTDKAPPALALAATSRVPSTERANAEAEEPAAVAKDGGPAVKLSALSGTPAIIDALNAQTRKRADRELGEKGLGPEHPDFMCFELVRQGAPGK